MFRGLKSKKKKEKVDNGKWCQPFSIFCDFCTFQKEVRKKKAAKDIKMQNVTFANTCRPNESAERNFFRWEITKGGKREGGKWNNKCGENWKVGNDEKKKK